MNERGDAAEQYLASGESLLRAWTPEHPGYVGATERDLLLFADPGRERGVRVGPARVALTDVVRTDLAVDESRAFRYGAVVAALVGAVALLGSALSLFPSTLAIGLGAVAVALLAAGALERHRHEPSATVTLVARDGGRREVRFADPDEAETLVTHVETFRARDADDE